MENKNLPYTSENLPIVSEAIIEIFARDYEKREKEKSAENFIREIKKRMDEENPLLNSYIESIAKDAQKKEEAGIFKMGAHITYELLRREVESNQLSNQLLKKFEEQK